MGKSKFFSRCLMSLLLIGSLLIEGNVASAAVGILYPNAGIKYGELQKKPPVTKEESGNRSATDSLGAEKGRELNIRVALAENAATVRLQADKGYMVNSKEGKILAEISPGEEIRLVVTKRNVVLNGKDTGSQRIFLSARASRDKVSYNGREYSGKLEIIAKDKTLSVINVLPLEDYIKGVLPAEMSPSWPEEALKAQAVAARTFALYTMQEGKHRGMDYDLCNATHCQAYEGMALEDRATSRAVEDTRGKIMLYKGNPIYAPFHASSGGATENSENVWGNYLPYLRSVKDDDEKSPYHNWQVAFSVVQMEKKLAAAGKRVGSLIRISMDQMANTGSKTERTPSGRVYSTTFEGTEGTIALTGQQVRQIFGLRSSMFTLRAERRANLPTSKKERRSLAERQQEIVENGGLSTGYNARGSLQLQGVEQVVFDGHGFGHGLGLAQYGAKAMAEKNAKYEDILHHYYTDVEIKKIY